MVYYYFTFTSKRKSLIYVKLIGYIKSKLTVV